MNSTTSISSPRTSSTPATSAHVVCDLAPWLRFAGLTRRSLHERNAAAAAEERGHRRVVADLSRDAEEEDLVGVERVEHRLRVRVCERVVLLLRDQDLTPPLEQAPQDRRRNGHERQRQRIELLRLGDLLRTARAEKAMRRPGAVVVRLLGYLGIGELVLIGGSDMDNAGCAGGLDEPRHRRPRLLGARWL